MEAEMQKGEVILYHPSETIKLEVRLENETVWLTQQQIADLFGVKQPAISKHLNNIFKEEELDQNSVHSILEYTASDGKIYKTNFYNLDAILSVGYRVNSKNATQFRRWANSILKEYLLKGYSVNNQLIQMEQRFEAKLLSQHDEILQIKQIQVHQQEQIDLCIKTNEEPKEMLFGNGCVLDAWNYISDLVRSAKREIESTVVDRLSGTPDVRLTTVEDFSGIPENKFPAVDDLSGLPVDSSTLVNQFSGLPMDSSTLVNEYSWRRE